MTVLCGDGKYTWADLKTAREPTRGSFWSELRWSHVHKSLSLISTLAKLQMSFSLCSQEAGIKVCGSGWRLAAAPPGRLPAVVLTEGHCTEKCVFQGARARVLSPALSEQPRVKGQAQSAGYGYWSDEKIIPPYPPLPVSLDLMRRQTICER